jgi:lipopolysaccharide transport system ATP-binding protein
VTKPAVEIRDLGKRYRIGAAAVRYKTVRDGIVHTGRAALRRLISSVDHARVSRPEIWALRDVSFDIDHGDVVGLIGRNGAGKSTLLKVLSRITEPTAGEVVLRGRVGSLLEVGTGFHPELTGRENIYLNAAILGMRSREIAAKFDSIVGFADIGAFLDTPVKHYSSGMGMRLAFAVAAHLDFDILLVDEVLAVGDLAFRKKSLGKMQEVSRGGRTVVFVSHDMNAIRRLCQRAVWLDGGRVRAVGPVQDVVREYEAAAARSATGAARAEREPDDSGRRRFGAVTLADGSGRPTSAFALGDVLTLTIEMDGRCGHRSHFVEWFLNDREQGNRVSWGATHAFPDVEVPSDAAIMSFTIGPLPLARGRYSISLAMGVPFVKDLDHWEDAIGFDVTSADPHNQGYQYTSRYAPTVIPYGLHVSEYDGKTSPR